MVLENKTEQSYVVWEILAWPSVRWHRNYCPTESFVGSCIKQKMWFNLCSNHGVKSLKSFQTPAKIARGLLIFWLGDASSWSGQSPEQPDMGWPCAEQGVGWRFPEALSNLYHPLMPWFERAEEISPHFAPDSDVWGCRIPCAARDRDNTATIMGFLPKSGARVHRNLASRNIIS